MPNHIKNILIITGAESEIKKLLKKVIIKEEGEENFDFNKLIPMPKSLDIESGSRTQLSYDYHSYKRNKELLPALELYFKRYQEETKDNDFENFLEYLLKEKIVDEKYAKTVYENKEKYGHTDWYSWSIANWNTKWNAYETYIDISSPTEVVIEFDTAWNSPQAVIRKLASLFPKLSILHKWASRNEDMGNNVGLIDYENGEICLEEDIQNGYSLSFEIYAECWGMDDCISKDSDGNYYRKNCDECNMC